MSNDIKDAGPWRGPTTNEWVQRINDGAHKVNAPRERQRWAVPWIVYVGRTSEPRS